MINHSLLILIKIKVEDLFWEGDSTLLKYSYKSHMDLKENPIGSAISGYFASHIRVKH